MLRERLFLGVFGERERQVNVIAPYVSVLLRDDLAWPDRQGLFRYDALVANHFMQTCRYEPQLHGVNEVRFAERLRKEKKAIKPSLLDVLIGGTRPLFVCLAGDRPEMNDAARLPARLKQAVDERLVIGPARRVEREVAAPALRESLARCHAHIILIGTIQAPD